MSDPNNLRLGYAHLAVQTELADERALADDLAEVLTDLDATWPTSKNPPDNVRLALARYREARQPKKMMTGVWPAKAGEATVALDEEAREQ